MRSACLIYLGNQGIDIIQANGALNAFDLIVGVVLGYILGGAVCRCCSPSPATRPLSGNGLSFNQTEVIGRADPVDEAAERRQHHPRRHRRASGPTRTGTLPGL